MFHRVVLSALQSVGCDVIDIGLTTTPTCQLAVEHHHAAGGLMISASHNPIEWNALKFIGPTGLFLENAEGVEMRALDRQGNPARDVGQARSDRGRRLVPLSDTSIVSSRYRTSTSREFGDASFTSRSTACAAPVRSSCRRCSSGWAVDVTAINLETDGRFPRPPEPVAENLGELERLVLETGAAIGFAVDPDVDRLALVSDAGKAIGEDFTLALAARLVLRHRPGSVVTNLSTSRLSRTWRRQRGCPWFARRLAR